MVRYQRAWDLPCSVPENRTGNDQSLDLRRAFINLRDSLVSVEFLHNVVLDESVPAVDFNGGVDGSVRGLRWKELRDTGFVRLPPPGVLGVCDAIGYGTAGAVLGA